MLFRISQIHYASGFRKAYRALPRHVQDAVDQKDALFREYPFHPTLRTHKLGGKLKELWSFWVKFEYRVLFEFRGTEAVFYDVGTHDIYR